MSMYNMLLLQDMVGWVGIEAGLFHDYTMMLLCLITVGFCLFLYFMVSSGAYIIKGYSSSDYLEFTWTVVPAFLLYSLGVPSLYLMYFMEGASKYDLTLKVIGHQWYWSYELNDFNSVVEFDSYMVNLSDLGVGDFRLLEVDNVVSLPFLSKVRVLVSSGDVLHAWALPSLGLKIDACPGRLNFMNVSCLRPSLVFGECSEICGVNHSFMPIGVEFVSWDDFLSCYGS
uniref:Cytochrome c oxidase subunit 2 n=1 Tax=Botrylloides giganteus TaxID=2034436 RepID=A0A024GWH7_9ASCI|nr:cytochrome c oxidase subunit II [Botrylloides giganteus]CCO25724.1 cytochrome c oxidase subunit II [Botrylloides giganteus]CDM98952.1 cytochrome c oxidase subunit II [Botrylloides giganteus]